MTTWAEAVRAWNAKNNAGGKYRIPAKGTGAYNEVMKMMGREPAKTSEPKAPQPEAPAAQEPPKAASREEKILRISEFIKKALEKRRAAKKEAPKEIPFERAKGNEGKKMRLNEMIGIMEKQIADMSRAAATTGSPAHRADLEKEMRSLKRLIAKSKKEYAAL